MKFHAPLILGLLTVFFLVACVNGDSTSSPGDASGAPPQSTSGTAPPGTSSPFGSTPTPDGTAEPTVSEGQSQLVNGMTVSVTVTQWNEGSGFLRSWTGLVNVLTYTLRFSVNPAPGTISERLDVEYQVFQGDSLFHFYRDADRTAVRQRYAGGSSKELLESIILPGPGIYSVKGSVGGEEFEVTVEAVQPPSRFGALVEPGTWTGRTRIDAGDLEGFLNVEGTWTGELPEGWQDLSYRGVVLGNLTQLELRVVDQFIEPVPTDQAVSIFDYTRPRFDLMAPVAQYEGTMRFFLGATAYEAGVGWRVCGSETVTYKLEGLLSYWPQFGTWGARLLLTGEIVQPFPALIQQLPQKVVIIATDRIEEIIPLRLKGGFTRIGPIILDTSTKTGFLFHFKDAQPNPASLVNDESKCMSRLRRFGFPNPLNPDAGVGSGLGLVAFRGDGSLSGGRITGRAAAGPGSAGSVSQGTAELRVNPSSEGPDYTSPIDRDGDFIFTDIPVRNEEDGAPILYTLNIQDARGLDQSSDGPAIEVLFESAIVSDVLVHSYQEVLLQQKLNMLFFALHDPKKWPGYRDNPSYVLELDAADVTIAMIQGQNEEATGINPATVNDDNFAFKMMQPDESGFSLHNDDSSEYEVVEFEDRNGRTAVRIYPLIDGERIPVIAGTYVFKFWNDNEEDDPFDTSCVGPDCNPPATDSGVRDFAGNLLDFIPNTQKPEPYVQITVEYLSGGAINIPEVIAISSDDY